MNHGDLLFLGRRQQASQRVYLLIARVLVHILPISPLIRAGLLSSPCLGAARVSFPSCPRLVANTEQGLSLVAIAAF
jgi:hypothetical protein